MKIMTMNLRQNFHRLNGDRANEACVREADFKKERVNGHGKGIGEDV
jgi:hypothetical protein